MDQTVDRQVDLKPWDPARAPLPWSLRACPKALYVFPPPPRARPPDEGIPLSVSGSLAGIRTPKCVSTPIESSQIC